MNGFSWIPFYKELANKLLDYKSNRQALLLKIEDIFSDLPIKYPYEYQNKKITDIDPFGIYGCFNRGISSTNRIKTLESFKASFQIEADVPQEFEGVPVFNNLNIWLSHDSNLCDIYWPLFESAIQYADTKEEQYKNDLCYFYDQAMKFKNGKWRITIGLFWIRPYQYMNLDYVNRTTLKQLPEDISSVFKKESLFSSGQYYLNSCQLFLEYMKENSVSYQNFPQFSSYALENIKKDKSSYWYYTAGDNNENWTTFYEKGIMSLNLNCSNLKSFSTKDELGLAIQDTLDEKDSLNSRVQEGWDFVHNIKINDIVYIRNGRNELLGRGIVTSDYYFDPDSQYSHFRQMEWTHKGVWSNKNDISCFSKYLNKIDDIKHKNFIKQIENLFETDSIWQPVQYDSGIDVKKWKEILEDSIVKENELNLLKQINEIGGQVTCKELSIQFGEQPGYYNQIAWNLAKKIVDKYHCSVYIDENQKEHYWPILFLGKEASKDQEGTFVWKLRDEIIEALNSMENYSIEDFKKEVFIEEDKINTLLHLLEHKKNIIFQGAPGTGKTFIAKRLAYLKMGKKKDDNIQCIQFHQNYSYEDFVMGYKPVEDGFKLQNGIFYEFCEKAKQSNEDFFFIIDEINRGNISKIFGELLQLIEKGYRNQPATLAYTKQSFYVPDNVYLIGMMNTADRSIALIDYALRRRFSFVDMEPGFDTEQFKDYLKSKNSSIFVQVIEKIKDLNKEIEEDPSLGKGFCIGHSYFVFEGDVDSILLKEVIQFDILPTLKEYWFDNLNQYNKWKGEFDTLLS